MRKLYNPEKSLFCQWSDHKFSKELQIISDVLDQHPQFIEWVASDLKENIKGKNSGAHGMSAEQILRAAILKQQNKWSYEFFEWQCVDSSGTRAFIKLDFEESYSKSTLQENIAKIKAETWIKINESLVRYARDKGIENGRTIRVHATAIESNIHAPTDSSLLFDCFKISDRVFKKIRKKTKKAYYSPLTTKQAKSNLLKIQYANGNQERLGPYKILIKEAKNLLKVINKVTDRFKNSDKIDLKPLKNIKDLLPAIIEQTERRVIKGEHIPPEEKIVSIFETHTDIIVKGKRDIVYGHKVFLTAGKSGLVTDCQLVQGNPSDKEYFLDLISQQKQLFGKVPRQITADGGFASEDNVYDAKEMGVKDVCFTKPVGLEIEEMVKSPWVFQKLRNFRAGIEGIISTLKRGFGLSKVLWKGVSGFASYVHSSVVSYNLTKIACLSK